MQTRILFVFDLFQFGFLLLLKMKSNVLIWMLQLYQMLPKSTDLWLIEQILLQLILAGKISVLLWIWIKNLSVMFAELLIDMDHSFLKTV